MNYNDKVEKLLKLQYVSNLIMQKSISLRVAAIAISLAFLVGSAAWASHSWNGYHWARTSSPFTLNLVDSVTTGWNSYLKTTSDDWSVSTALDTTIVSGNDSSATRKRCSAVLGKDRVCNAAYGNNGWLGLAQVWVYSDGHIAQGVVKLNDTYFNTSTYNTPAWRNLVMCQEVGHTLGLAHVDEVFNNANLGTCMDYTNDPNGGPGGASETDPSNEHPNAHDYTQLESIYAHLTDAFNSFSNAASTAKATNAADINTSSPKEWGKAVKQDARGKNSLYERDLGNGEKLFTFVVWAD